MSVALNAYNYNFQRCGVSRHNTAVLMQAPPLGVRMVKLLRLWMAVKVGFLSFNLGR